MFEQLSKKAIYYTLFRFILFIMMIPVSLASVDVSAGTYHFVPKSWEWYITGILFSYMSLIFLYDSRDMSKTSHSNRVKLIAPQRYKLLKITELFFSTKTQEETFEQAMADWDFEVFEATRKKESSIRLNLINLRNIYHFTLAMWQKSPLGDLIEFVRKIAK